jgi:hypothetical protein
MMYRRSSIPGVWREMQRFQDDMNRLFDSSLSGSYYHFDSIPTLNIFHSGRSTGNRRGSRCGFERP